MQYTESSLSKKSMKMTKQRVTIAAIYISRLPIHTMQKMSTSRLKVCFKYASTVLLNRMFTNLLAIFSVTTTRPAKILELLIPCMFLWIPENHCWMISLNRVHVLDFGDDLAMCYMIYQDKTGTVPKASMHAPIDTSENLHK